MSILPFRQPEPDDPLVTALAAVFRQALQQAVADLGSQVARRPAPPACEEGPPVEFPPAPEHLTETQRDILGAATHRETSRKALIRQGGHPVNAHTYEAVQALVRRKYLGVGAGGRRRLQRDAPAPHPQPTEDSR